MSPLQRTKPARKSARSGVGDGSPSPHPPHLQPVGSGPGPQARKDGRSGVGERPIPDAPHLGRSPPPPRAPSSQPHSAQSQLTRARAVGLLTGPHARIPFNRSHLMLGPGCTPQRTGGRWGGERPTPDTPHPGKTRPPQASSCRPHSAQGQLARARAVGLVTGPQARIFRTHSQWVVGPGHTPQRTGGRGCKSARP